MTNLTQTLMDWISSHPQLTAVLLPAGWLTALVVLVLCKAPRRWREFLKRASRWINGHLVQLLCWLALPALTVALVRSYLDPQNKPYHQMVLLGLILATAILAQLGNDLLTRLYKVGPVEFLHKKIEAMRPEFRNLKIDLTFPDEKLSPKLLYEYEKADRYVTYLEWSGLPKGTSGHESFYELLFNVGFVALNQRYWLRAIDRLELLLDLSGEGFNAAEAHYHCGLAYLYWAPSGRVRQTAHGTGSPSNRA